MKARELARVVAASANRKLGGTRGAPVAATYVPVGPTCPPCPFLDDGCYAQNLRPWIVPRYADTPEAHARAEAAGIRALPPDGRPLRLHVSGDARTNKAARILGAAVNAWQRAGGGV